MISGHVLYRVEFQRVLLGQCFHCILPGIFVDIPEGTGIEAATPPIDIRGNKLTVGRERAGKCLFCQAGVHSRVLLLRNGKYTVNQRLHRLLLRAGGQCQKSEYRY